MVILFSLLVAVFAVSLLLIVMVRLGLITLPRVGGGVVALSFIFSSIALGVMLAIRYAPALWNLTQ